MLHEGEHRGILPIGYEKDKRFAPGVGELKPYPGWPLTDGEEIHVRFPSPLPKEQPPPTYKADHLVGLRPYLGHETMGLILGHGLCRGQRPKLRTSRERTQNKEKEEMSMARSRPYSPPYPLSQVRRM